MVNIKGSKAWLGVLEYLCDPQWLRAKKTAVFLQDSQADVMWPSPAQWDRFLAKRPVQPSSQFKKKMLCVCGGKKIPKIISFPFSSSISLVLVMLLSLSFIHLIPVLWALSLSPLLTWSWEVQFGTRSSWSQHLCVLAFSSTLHGAVLSVLGCS